MADSYLDLVNSGAGAAIATKLGLPRPAPLLRYRPGDPLVAGPVLVLGSGPDADAVARTLLEWDAAVHRHPHSPLFYATHDLQSVVADLHAAGVQSLFVEGGPTLASAFIAAGLADRVLAYIAPVLLGGDRLALTDIGVTTIDAARRLTVEQWVPLGADLLAVAGPAQKTHEEGDA